ncbi:MAG TPA: hypothetical protein PK585_12855 [Amphiplicatus sp.]|nr:hypothetical protein [Amphiplicatus sp.]
MRHHFCLSVAAVGAAACLSQSAAAADASPVKSTATLTVVYEVKGGGDDIPQSHERHVRWSINDRYEAKSTMEAAVVQAVGVMHPQPEGAGAQIDENDQAAMMALAMGAQAKCGADADCLQREMMKAITGSAGSYQGFSGTSQTGSYSIDEKAYQAYFDAACSLKNEAACAYDTTVTGAGQISEKDGPRFLYGARAEVDLEAGTLMIAVPWPGYLKATKTVTSASKEIETGTTQIERGALLSGAKREAFKATCGACKNVSGTETVAVKDELLGRDATLTMRWTFTRQ